jgi:hypothetical protein
LRRTIGLAVLVVLTVVRSAGAAEGVKPLVVPVSPAAGNASSQKIVEDAFRTAGRLRAGRKGDVVVEFAAGTYRLDRPIVIDGAKAGDGRGTLVVRGVGDVTITGSQPLIERQRRKADDAVFDKVPATARQHVRLYELPGLAARSPHVLIPRAANFNTEAAPFEVFDESGALGPAAWPNDSTATAQSHAGDLVALPQGKRGAWRGEPDLWLAGRLWSYEVLRVTFIDEQSDKLRLYPPSPLGIADDAPFQILHAASELDAPGEWYRSPDRSTLFAIPREEPALEISLAENLFVIRNARDVKIHNLTLQRSRGAAVVVRDSQNVILQNLDIRWTGGRGAVIQGGTANGVEACSISDTGDGGVLLTGGDRHALAPGRHFLRNSTVRRFQRLTRSYRGAADLVGVGNDVVGNFIADAQHYAIRFQGNNHTISSNEITRVVLETSDMGAIYTGRDWATLGTSITHNFVHNIGDGLGKIDTKGVYLDDGASGTVVRGNIFANTPWPAFVGGGHDNTVEGNVFIRSEPAILLDGRGLTWARTAITDRKSEIWQRLFAVPFRSKPWVEQYPRLAGLLNTDAGIPRGNVFRNNVFIGGQDFEILPEVSLEAQSIAGNVSIAADDPRLVPPLSELSSPTDLLRTSLQRLIEPALPYLPSDLAGLEREKVLQNAH